MWVFALAVLTVVINIIYVQMRTQNTKAAVAMGASGAFFLYTIYELRQPNACGHLALLMVLFSLVINLVMIEGYC